MDLLKLSYDSTKGLTFSVSWWIIAVFILAIVVLLFIKWKYLNKRYPKFEINEAKIGIGKQSITIKPSYQDLQIAYQLWIELSTRKIGLAIDKDNDVIHQLYNSWYEFFKISRELLKTIPVRKFRANKSTQEIIELSFKILNNALRPHLTKWQARYRFWLASSQKEEGNCKLTPQELQKKYPQYEELEKDLLRVNETLIKYKEFLEKLINIK